MSDRHIGFWIGVAAAALLMTVAAIFGGLALALEGPKFSSVHGYTRSARGLTAVAPLVLMLVLMLSAKAPTQLRAQIHSVST